MSFEPNPPPALEIRSIWEDDGIFEISVRARNGAFCGECRCYTTREEMKKLAAAITGFPRTVADEVRFSTCSSDSFAHFGVHIFCTDGSGHTVARVKIADVVHYSNARPVNNLAEFDLPAEPAAIDAFVRELAELSTAGVRAVTAVLNGKA